MAPRYRDKEWLRMRYQDDGLTQAEIADECDVSPRCIRKWMQKHSIETRNVEGENHGLYGDERDEETKSKIANSLSGREFSRETKARLSKAQKERSLDEQTKERISAALTGREKSPDTRLRMSEASVGEQNSNWKGGHTKRYGAGWKAARKETLSRDEICQNCGEDGSDQQLDVHHNIPVRVFEEHDDANIADAHALANTIVLCKRCHALVEHGKIEVQVP